MYQVVKLSEKAAKQICEWRYEGEYAIYNLSTWEDAVKGHWPITNEVKRTLEFRGVLNSQGQLSGFFRMSMNEEGYIEVALGMKPNLCGQGLGKSFVREITRYVEAQAPNRQICIEVRQFNQRAIKCYAAVGYEIIKEHMRQTPWGIFEYYRMEYRSKN